MANNNDLGSLSYSLNIDISKIPDTLRDVEKQLSAIGAAHKIDVNVDEKKFIEQLGKVLYGENFKINVSLDESYKKIIADLKKQMSEIKVPQVPTAKIKETSALIEKTTKDQARGFSMLQYEIGQVVRETPSIAYGINTYMAALSNNLPMLADQIKKAKVEYSQLIALGQKATPVWKQVIGSIFSWQTALVAVLTVFTLFGREIVNHIQGMLGLKKGVDAVKKAIDEATNSMGAELGQLKALFNALNNATQGL